MQDRTVRHGLDLRLQKRSHVPIVQNGKLGMNVRKRGTRSDPQRHCAIRGDDDCALELRNELGAVVEIDRIGFQKVMLHTLKDS